MAQLKGYSRPHPTVGTEQVLLTAEDAEDRNKALVAAGLEPYTLIKGEAAVKTDAGLDSQTVEGDVPGTVKAATTRRAGATVA
jgi:hypothetical protein